jgi:hypothetical protein
MRHFIILIGGPATFQSCDKQHDQVWRNYIVPPQLAAERDLYRKSPDEKIHWVVYEQPYELRWNDDSVITPAEKRQCDGAWLHSVRKEAADGVLRKAATNYLHRIQAVAGQYNINYKGIRTPQGFWDYLAAFPRKSVSRVWYFGHAAGSGLMLALTHDSACEPSAERKDIIYMDGLYRQSHLADRFISDTRKASRFYGCFTNDFARTWSQVFKVPAEGASRTIDFGVVDRASDINCVLERIKRTPTSKGDPGWTKHRGQR